MSRDLPANTSGCTLIRPGGRACYPAVWTQDFAIALETGFVTPEEMLDHLDLIAHHLWRATKKCGFLRRKVNGVTTIDRLRLAFHVPRIDEASGLVFTDEKRRAVGFIFCDSIYMTGHLLFASLLPCIWGCSKESGLRSRGMKSSKP